MIRPILLALVLAVVAQVQADAQSRVKDIALVDAARENLLVGFGLVIGLNGTGDSLRNTPVTESSLRSMFDKLGIASGEASLRAKNVAAVVASAKLPAFARPGAKLDVTVSSVGDASSLKGGTLIMTPLRDAAGNVVAAAQGQILVSGFAAQGAAESVTSGTPTVGRLPGGGIVEHGLEAQLSDLTYVQVRLRNPDFSTAIALTDAINDFSEQSFGQRVARELDSATVVLVKPAGVSMARFVARIEQLPVEVDQLARVVVDERTGTVVIGEKVRVSTVAVAHGTLTVRVTEAPLIVQPDPLSNGETAVQPQTAIDVDAPEGQLARISGTTLQDLIGGLNQMGVKPSDMIAILQAIKSAGALQAELLIQ